MRSTKRMLITLLAVVMLMSSIAVPAMALEPSWNDYFSDNFPEQRVGYYHYGYTYMLQRFLYINPETRNDITSNGGIDGMFGNGTSRAIKTFQENAIDSGISISSNELGKVGSDTWWAIAYNMYEIYFSGYQHWYYINSKVVNYNTSTKQMQYYINDSTIGGTFHTVH